ncbi:MAG: hypothetical protein U5R30_04815 [Deltaproteobacteria bacterium]|nr:hypothetical protein [Deltaproteobacteria bacterium]
MRKRRSSKLIRENQYVVEVDIELMDAKEGWAPYMSLDDALKLDDVRSVLPTGRSRSRQSAGSAILSRPWMFDETSFVDDRLDRFER